ncbi:ATP synthase F1 subunit epsilon [Candidatus Nomurabacteria bacterium]|nr:ATP synthase F1 subunit epsilon [Candidatus Nomurabacteria bacterium]MCB9820658.1 ATP synthase F1 subunit epsilon [Candidatus Nomurabacteria bacterium]
MSNSKIKLNIITPTKTAFSDEGIDNVVIPTTSGEITVLPNHIPLVSSIKVGEIRIHKDGQIIPLAISGGLLEVRKDSELVILAESSELAREMNVEQIQAAYDRAVEAMNEPLDTQGDMSRERSLEIELNRLNIAKKWR